MRSRGRSGGDVSPVGKTGYAEIKTDVDGAQSRSWKGGVMHYANRHLVHRRSTALFVLVTILMLLLMLLSPQAAGVPL